MLDIFFNIKLLYTVNSEIFVVFIKKIKLLRNDKITLLFNNVGKSCSSFFNNANMYFNVIC